MKKIIAVALALAMILCAFPFAFTAYAENGKANVNIDGTDYSLDIGDVICYTYYLDMTGVGDPAKLGKATEIQGSFIFDKQKLAVVTCFDPDESEFSEVLPNINKGLFNVSNDAETFLGYSALLKSGYLFAPEKVLVQVSFEVIGEGDSALIHQLECLGSGDVRIIENNEFKVAEIPGLRSEIRILKQGAEPTEPPTEAPTAAPTQAPTSAPTQAPTAAPTTAPIPTSAPVIPTEAPTAAPTDAPVTDAPTQAPVTEAPVTEAPTLPPTQPPTQVLPTEAPVVITTDPATGISVITDDTVQLMVTKVDMKSFGYLLADAPANDDVYSITMLKRGMVWVPSEPITVTIPKTANGDKVVAIYADGTVEVLESGNNSRVFSVQTKGLEYLAVLPADAEAITYELGNVDLDNEVSILDATAIQRLLVGLFHANDVQLLLADTDKDGEPSILDATAIQRWLVGLPNTFRPVG